MEDDTIEETAAPTKKPVFEGFRKPEKPNKNFYHVPNEWTDIMAEITNLSELKIIEYIMRHTWGFKEYGTLKLFTTEEFVYGRKRKDGTRMDRGTGLGTTAAKQGIAKAIEHGYVICETDESDKGRIKKYYGLKMLPTPDLDSHNVTPDGHDPTMHGHDTTPDGHNVTPDSHDETMHGRNETGWVSQDDHRSEKETSERNLEKNTKERKNGKSRQNSTSSAQQESSHSFAPSQDKSSFSSERTKPAIVLTEKEQQIVKFGKKDIFKAADPIIDEKLKEECAILAELIETQEDFDSLVAVVRAHFPKGVIHLKNLTKPSVLNEWSQIRSQCTPEPPMPGNDETATDEDLLEDIKNTVRFYGADDRFEECLENIMDFKRKAELSNYKVCDMMANASIGVQREHGIDAFLEKLQYSLYW